MADYNNPVIDQIDKLSEFLQKRNEDQAKYANEEKLVRLQNLLKGQSTDEDIARLQRMKDQGLVEEGGQAKVGEVSTGADPYARAYQQNQFKDIQRLQQDQSAVNKEMQPVTKGLGEIKQAHGLLDLAAKGNQIANNVLPILMDKAQTGSARAASSPALIAKYGTGKRLDTRLNQAMTQAAHGTLTPDNYGFLKDMIDQSESVYNDNLNEIRMRHANQRAIREGETPDLSYRKLFNTAMPTPKEETPVNQNPVNPTSPPKLHSFFGDIKDALTTSPEESAISKSTTAGPPPGLDFAGFQKWKQSQGQ